MNDKKTIRAWCIYDWANSVYSLTITSAIFPIYFQSVAINSEGGDKIIFLGLEITNSVLYSYSLSFSFLVVALVMPLLSGIADYSKQKKTFLTAFMLLGSISCIGLFFFDRSTIEWGIFCSICASIGYSGSLVFYDAYLNEIVSPDKRDHVSAKGYAYGYIGGVILLIANLLMIEFYDSLGLANKGEASQWSFLSVGVWWIGFGLFSISQLPKGGKQHPHQQLITKGYQRFLKTARDIRNNKSAFRFLIAFFFYNMGVQTVMYLAALFGSKELKLEESTLIITILLIQFVAVMGAFLFARISKKKGNLNTLTILIGIWILICIYAFFVTEEAEFFLLASVVGAVMGGIQALSRSTFSKIIPAASKEVSSYFGLYDIAFVLSIVVGTFIYGYIEQITGSMRNSSLTLATFFIIGLIVLRTVKMPHENT